MTRYKIVLMHLDDDCGFLLWKESLLFILKKMHCITQSMK